MTTLITTRNPGIGLKLTAPRISRMAIEPDSPSPQMYQVKVGTFDLTDRQKNQNAILSQRYMNVRPSTASGIVSAQTREETVISKPKLKLDSFPIRAQTNAAKNSSKSSISTEPGFYSIRGMADQTDRQRSQNKLLSNRYTQ